MRCPHKRTHTQPSGAVHQQLPPTITFPHSDPWQLTKCTSFHCPTLQTHLGPHKEIGKPSTGLPLGQAHTLLFPNKNTLTSVRERKAPTPGCWHAPLPAPVSQCVYLLSLSSSSPLRMAQERELRGMNIPPPHPFLNNEKREKEGGKSLSAEDLTGLLKSNVSTGFNPPLAFKS